MGTSAFVFLNSLPVTYDHPTHFRTVKFHLRTMRFLLTRDTGKYFRVIVIEC